MVAFAPTRTRLHLIPLIFLAFTMFECREFFREIELDEEMESEETDTNASEDDDVDSESGKSIKKDSGDPCQIEDEECTDQDIMLICDPESETSTMVSCRELCGDKINISCLQIDSSHHACWCQLPGARKNSSCTELETCVERCAQQASDECMSQCFSRTDSLTARLYGALLYCAEEQCHALCHTYPELCPQCVVSARSGMDGACVIERSLCDQDEIESM